MAVQKDYDINKRSVYLGFWNIPTKDFDRDLVFYISYDGGVTWYEDGRYTIEAGEEDIEVDHYYTGLTPGTTYMFKGVLYSTAENTYGPYTWTTLPDYAHVISTIIATATHNRITAFVFLASPVSYDVDLTFYLDDGRPLSCDIPAGSTYEDRAWSTDISPLEIYNISVWDNMIDKEWGSTNVVTKANFSWKNTVKYNEEFNIEADGVGGWNDFTSQLKRKVELHAYQNRTFTTAVKGENFTDAMFNQAVNAINYLVSYGADGCVTTMSTVSKGDPITAAAINQLANCLNE